MEEQIDLHEHKLRTIGQKTMQYFLSTQVIPKYYITLSTVSCGGAGESLVIDTALCQATVNDVMETLEMSNTHTLKDTMQNLFQNDFVDGKVLYHSDSQHVCESLTLSNIKLTSNNAMATSYKSTVIVQYGIKFNDGITNNICERLSSQKFGMYVWESVETYGDESLRLYKVDLPTSFLRCGILVEEMEQHVEDSACSRISFFIIQLNASQETIAWMKRLSSCVHRIEKAILGHHIIHFDLVGKKQWRNNELLCSTCGKSLKAFSVLRKHHCRLCGKMICSQCSRVEVFKLYRFGGSPKQIRLCKKLCYQRKDFRCESTLSTRKRISTFMETPSSSTRKRMPTFDASETLDTQSRIEILSAVKYLLSTTLNRKKSRNRAYLSYREMATTATEQNEGSSTSNEQVALGHCSNEVVEVSSFCFILFYTRF